MNTRPDEIGGAFRRGARSFLRVGGGDGRGSWEGPGELRFGEGRYVGLRLAMAGLAEDLGGHRAGGGGAGGRGRPRGGRRARASHGTVG